MKRVYILISGRVQGVFFRRFVIHNAMRLNVNGYVKNLGDGKIEAVLEGSEEQVDELIKLCKQGPIGAKIESVDIKEEKYKGEFSNFEVRY